MQTLKQNTEAPLPQHSSVYDVPRSPSTGSHSSSRTYEYHSLASSGSSQQTVSCQTQTTPTASPKAGRSGKKVASSSVLHKEKCTKRPFFSTTSINARIRTAAARAI